MPESPTAAQRGRYGRSSRSMRLATDQEESAEERRLWADFYEATARVLELIRREGTKGKVVSEIAAEHDIAGRALARIKEIRGIR